MVDLTNVKTLAVGERRPARGPVTRRRLRRFLCGLAVIAAAAIALILTTDDSAVRAFALGVLLPGAGFSYGTESPLLAVALIVATVLALLISVAWWTLFGNILAPPTVILGSAALAGVTTSSHVRPNAVPIVLIVFGLLIALALVRDTRRHRAAQRRARERNTYLATIAAPTPRAARFETTELSEEDLAHQRWLLNLALQPLDRFDGFDRLDQFSFSALRYQLNFSQYALAMAQRHHTPAFHGYLAAAQRNLIEKMLQPRVWRYWRLENLWGNLDLNPDPIRRDNIMFSGYFALMLSLYRNTSGDTRYDRPGSLEIRTRGGRVFSYDHPTIVQIVARQFGGEPSGLWACEPGFSYPMCNALGAAGVLGADPLHGGTLAVPVLKALRRGLDEEYTFADGSPVHVRSIRFGFATPGVGSGSVMGAWQRANLPLLLHPVDPVTAQRHWEVLRREDAELVDGEFTLRRANASDRRDVGNLRNSMANFWSWLYADAREFGDSRIASAALHAAEEQLAPRLFEGARAYTNASVHSNAVFALGRFNREYGYADAVTAPLPTAWREGPLLADAPYPECLVAQAETDGSALRLVLRPGNGAQRVELSVDRLVPNASYEVRGAGPTQATAAPDGSATLHVDLDDRVEVLLYRSA
jgi:Linalool dehydratase/isomerase